MPKPVFGVTTERMYAALPEHYRDADAERDYPLLRFMALIGDYASVLDNLLTRFDRAATEPGGLRGSDLVDPERADEAWLPWLAQLVGIRASELAPSAAERRRQIADVGARWQAGSTASIVAAVQAVLTGTKEVRIDRHHNGNPFHVLIRTRFDETDLLNWNAFESNYPDWGAIEAAGSWDAFDPGNPLVAIKLVEPAGVEFFHQLGVGDWDSIESEAPTWDDIEAAGSWNAVQDL